MKPHEWDEQYQDPHRYRTWPSEEMIRFLAPMVYATDNPPRALDLGCGAGGNLWALLSMGFSAYGLDPSPQARAAAGLTLRRHGYAHAPVYYGTAESIPFPDAFFDVVIETMTLQHVIERRDQAFRECARVLRPGGAILSVHLLAGTNYAAVFPGVPAAHLAPDVSALAAEWERVPDILVSRLTRTTRTHMGDDGQPLTVAYGVLHLRRHDPGEVRKA